MDSNKDKVRSILTERRKELGYTMKELAALVGVSEGTISRWESGDIANMRRDRISKLAQALKISPAVIMGWDNSYKIDFHLFGSDSDDKSPLHEAAAGEGRLNDGYPTEEFKIQLESDEIVVRVVGRSMEPTLQDGDIVVIQAQSLVDYPRQIALVKINGEEATLKRVEIRDDGVMLIGDNVDVYPPHFFTAEEVEQLPVKIEGVVTKLIRDIK